MPQATAHRRPFSDAFFFFISYADSFGTRFLEPNSYKYMLPFCVLLCVALCYMYMVRSCIWTCRSGKYKKQQQQIVKPLFANNVPTSFCWAHFAGTTNMWYLYTSVYNTHTTYYLNASQQVVASTHMGFQLTCRVDSFSSEQCRSWMGIHSRHSLTEQFGDYFKYFSLADVRMPVIDWNWSVRYN